MADKPVHPRVRAKLTKRQVEDKRSTLTKQADKAIQLLGDTLSGKVQPTKAQMDAAKVVLSKTMPDLKSIEQTNKQEQRNPQEIEAQLVQLAKDNPELIQLLIGHIRQDKGPKTTNEDKGINETKH